MEAKIKDLANRRDLDKLHKYVRAADTKDLCEYVTDRICNGDFPRLFNHILESFDETVPSQSKRLKFVEAALNALKNAKMTNSQANTIVCRIIVDFPQYSSTHLVKLVDYCEERIRQNDDDFMSWKDVLPQLLEVLEERNSVNNNGAEMTGKEYKESVLRSLYSGQWDSAVLPSLTSMFREMSMSKEEHKKVVSVLCHRLSNMQPNELPPLVHQLLALCRHQHAAIIVTALCKYFQTQYAKLNDDDSEQYSEDISVFSLKDIQECESTILYHISHAAEMHQIGLRDFIKSLNGVTNVPEYLLDPFIMTLLLHVSNIYEDEVLDLLRMAMSRMIRDNERQKHSAWLNEVLENNCAISKTINSVVTNSIKDRHVVVKGLVDLSFLMMGVGTKLGDEVHTGTLWDIGNKILQKLIKKRFEIGPTVIQCLTDRIIRGGAAVSQYTNCLATMCRKVPLLMMECQVWIVTLLEQLIVINPAAATQVIFAVLPIVKVRQEVRDTLSMVLRKALYSSNTATRLMAVTGFLQLLKNFKMNSLGALSQSTSCNGSSTTSNASVHTQTSLEVHRKADTNPQMNILLCFEVLGILKRCFTQQAEVKMCLYEGLADVIQMNPQLAAYLIEMLLNHFQQYYEPDANILPPLKLAKCTSVRGAESVLQEPIGNLILVMQMIYVQATSEDSSEILKLGFLLESLCNRMAKSKLEHFELDDGIDIFDNVPESQEKLHNLKQMVIAYEALMTYRIVTWTKESSNPAHKVYALFEGYNRLVARFKPAGKPKKADGKKKKDKDPDATFKRPGRPTTATKLPPTILDLDTVAKVLSLLHSESVPWSSNVASRELRGRELFHRYILQTCIQLFQRTNKLKNDDLEKHKRQDVIKCFVIGQTIYKKIVCQLDQVREFDQHTAVLGLECFKEVCVLACTNNSIDMENFLKKTVDSDPDADTGVQLMSVITRLKDLLVSSLDEEDDEEASIAKKIAPILLGTLTHLIPKLPADSKSIDETRDWLIDLATNRQLDNPMSVALVQLILKVEVSTSEYGESINRLVDQLCQTLGTIDAEEQSATEGDVPFKILNDLSALQFHGVICSVMKQKIDDASWFLSRLKAEHALSTMPGMDVDERAEALKEKERKLGHQLCLIVQTLQTLANVSIAPGNAEIVFKNFMNVFSTLSAFTKYFHNKSTPQNPVFQAVRFVSLVKLAGRPLAKTLYSLITHIEENQKTMSKSKIVDAYAQRSKILKSTKIIPRTIYELEQFGKNILLLGKKTKVPLEEFVNYRITRDFRIKNPALVKGLETLDVSSLNTQTTNNDTSVSGHSSDNSDQEREPTPPPSKKSKKTRTPKK